MRKRPSRTAIKVAKGVFLIGEDPQLATVLPEEAANLSERLLLAHHGWFRLERWLLRRTWIRFLIAKNEQWWIPGASVHIAVRKRYFDDWTRAGIRDGASQVVILGGGFDTLSLRLSMAHPQVTFFEIDHPSTSHAKRAVCDKVAPLPPNLRLIAADFTRTTLNDVLNEAPGYSRDLKTVFLAEGLLMYLGESEVEALFETVRSSSGDASTLIASYIERDEDGIFRMGKRSKLLTRSLKWMGEPFLWGPPPGGFEDFVNDRAWTLVDQPDVSTLRARYPEIGESSIMPWEKLSVLKGAK